MARFLAQPKPADPAQAPTPAPAPASGTPPSAPRDRGVFDALGRAVTSPVLDTAAEADPWLPPPGREDDARRPAPAAPAAPRRRPG